MGQTIHCGNMRKYIIIVTDRQIYPARSGNKMRILGLIRALRLLGWSVALVIPAACYHRKLHQETDRLFLVAAPSFASGDVLRYNFRPLSRAVRIAAKTLKPSAIIAEYAWLAPAARNVPPGVLRLVDCHDVLHERTDRFDSINADSWVRCTAMQERTLLNHADVVLAIQSRDADVIRRLLPSKRTYCLLPYVELPDGFRLSHSETFNVLAVGASHAGNQGILDFAVKVWPRILIHVAQARFKVVGTIGRGMPALPGVEWLGEVADLSTHYRDSAVVVCPITVGTGVKIKMLEALRFGKAVVATPAAEEGLPFAQDRAWVAAGSLDDFADPVALLLTASGARVKLERRAFRYGEEHLSRRRFLANLRRILPDSCLRRVRRPAQVK